MLLHVDGARLANAAASLGVPFRKCTTAAGVDLVSFGGTKNGAMGAEAVLFLSDRCDPADFPFIRKQGMQLGSKMRFLSAQFLALLEGDLWRRNAEHANRMARLLAERVIDRPDLFRVVLGPSYPGHTGHFHFDLAPYRLVKDERTRHESGNVDAVLDGDLDEFIEAWLQWRRREGA